MAMSEVIDIFYFAAALASIFSFVVAIATWLEKKVISVY